ncbi:MAG: aldo/keto reductase, partial [Chloroflexota bacterium]|nr:aldo/keto reductase [Chloroflexota bacterium]
MQYRKLGKTGLEVSAVGLGCAQLGSSSTEYAVRIVQRALELGVNYLDTARGYWDSEVKMGIALKGQRQKALISTKTTARTREDAWRHINESLERLQTDYLDNVHLHGLWDGEDFDTRFGPGGALEAVVEAKRQGLTRHIGCTSHLSRVLVKALHRYDFEVILVPMNIAEREPLDQLIPLCQQKGVGVTIMKPLATGLLPAKLALKWLLNQPVASVAPGTTTIEEMEENASVGSLEDMRLTSPEAQEAARIEAELAHVRCRVCRACEPCPKSIPIGSTLGTDVMYDHHRTMGAEAFQRFAWSSETVREDIAKRVQTIAAIEACDDCGLCEP